MTVGELVKEIITMLEEDRIQITDNVEVDIKTDKNIISGSLHELLVRETFSRETMLTIRS